MSFNTRITYDEISPITGNMSVLIDKDEETGIISKLCMESGFTTNTLMVDTEEFWESLKYHFPIGHRFAFKDKNDVIWIPSAQATTQAAIFPVQYPDKPDEVTWQVVPALQDESIPENELELDFDASKNFSALEFTQAFDLFAQLSNLQIDEEE